MTLEALHARLQVLEEEIVGLTKLASEAMTTAEQDNYWLLAQDLQRDARELRAQIRKLTAAVPNSPAPQPPKCTRKFAPLPYARERSQCARYRFSLSACCPAWSLST